MRSRLSRSFLVIASVCVVACGARKPPTPDQLRAWMVGRFSPELVAKVEGGQIRFEGGDGNSRDAAVVIVGADGDREGVPAEYLWIAQRHGIQGVDWGPAEQSVTRPDDKGRRFDVLTIDVANQLSRKTYYFDVTGFYGKESTWFPVPR